MEKYFKCNSCHQLIDDVFESECCGKLFCSNCIGILVNKSCPHCSNKKMHFGKNHFAQRLLKSIKVTCKYGCGKKFPYDEMRRHLLICENKEYFCSFDNCSFKGKKNEILKHLIKSHQIFMLTFMEYYDNFNTIMNKILKGTDKKFLNDEKEDETLVDFVNSDNFDDNEFPLIRVEQSGFRNENEFDSFQDDDLIIHQPPIRSFNNRYNGRRGFGFNEREEQRNDRRIGINQYENAFLDDLPFFRNNNNHNNHNHNNVDNVDILDVTRSDFE